MNIVIVGAGLAGANAAEELRAQGYSGDITLIGEEPHRPYERPPLSKGLLLGTADPDSVFTHPTAWYANHQVDLVTGAPVTEIDLDTSHLTVRDRQLSYDRLLLATGARPRRLPMADTSGAEVVYLRTLDDALALAPRLTEHLLIIGGGWIGLEVAAAARQAGGTVTVVESATLPLVRVLGQEVAPMVADLHREHGVDLRLGVGISGVEHAAGCTTVRLDDGAVVTPDLILVGIGADPDDALAARAGLATDHGVMVDARLRASDPHVYSAGDVANHDHPLHGRLRVEHWDAAIHQGKHAARVMLGDDQPYLRQPYFFTDQYDLGIEYVGHVGPRGYDEVVIRGSLANRTFTALWISDDCVAAGMHANDWDAVNLLRGLVGRRATAATRDTSVTLEDALNGV
ncbi:pyridine nucleotide-disulfide oxidoreductase [Nocardioides sp. Root122]|uniref:NAD(P)/FAD-dependent oxidoreductase n=1 Tax=Nocardioides TaxID=1839 RepID=UPI000702660D|nr:MULTISPECIES: FAD-dependent oxidoreductase [Nocardioides]KQV69996.1 pyridine nucleotide-disulfide oxidoreductase [Nocardioides sp. Root122]MCK9825030.1 FAD-dependent oxidoreductase [Nocardioides cavernae]